MTNRHRDRERAPLPGGADDVDRSAQMIEEVRDEREAEPRAAERSRRGGVGLIEALEDPRELIGGNADAVVADPEDDRVALGARSELTRRPIRRVLERVIDEVLHDAGEELSVRVEDG